MGRPHHNKLSELQPPPCTERREAWRNKEYAAQRTILADVDAGKIPMEEFLTNAREMLNERVSGGVLAKA